MDRPCAAPTEPGLTLALNSAEARVQIVLFDAPGELVVAQEWHAPSGGVELLVPALGNALRLSGHRPADIARIACVRGPGSFTGLRLALATAAGLARTARMGGKAPLAGLDYMPLLAMNALPFLHTTDTVLWVVTHARRNLVQAQAFRRNTPFRDGNGNCVALTDLIVAHIADDAPENRLATHIAALGGRDRPLCLVGSGVARNREALLESLSGIADVCCPGPDYDHPSLTVLMRAARNAVFSTADPEALYVRPCDAEENLPRIAAGLGLDPEAARSRLTELMQAIQL